MHKEQPMTEKRFLRILASTVCGIILCLVGLVSTSWAWYSMDIVCTNNEIRVGQFDVSVTVTSGGEEIDQDGEGYALPAGTYQVQLASLDSNTAPGYCIVKVWENEMQTVALYPTTPGSSGMTTLTFELTLGQNGGWLEIIPVLGMPNETALLTKESEIIVDGVPTSSEESLEP